MLYACADLIHIQWTGSNTHNNGGNVRFISAQLLALSLISRANREVMVRLAMQAKALRAQIVTTSCSTARLEKTTR